MGDVGILVTGSACGWSASLSTFQPRRDMRVCTHHHRPVTPIAPEYGSYMVASRETLGPDWLVRRKITYAELIHLNLSICDCVKARVSVLRTGKVGVTVK